MSRPAKLVVTKADAARQTLADLVMAWARDAQTGEPRYILELDEHHRGAKCGCAGPSCALPVTAVNAAKTEFVKRPHFRHPEGADGQGCLVLAARAAALRQMQESGWIDLLRRRVTTKLIGLSGRYHEAWVDAPAQRVHISQVKYRDRATAVFTLADGKQLLVDPTGTAGQLEDGGQAGDGLLPTIYLGIDDPALAAMSPDELRKRLKLIPTELCWLSHWDDAEL